MENMSSITGAGQRESLMSQVTQNNEVSVRQQQQGFYQVSSSGTALVSNTYGKTGAVSTVEVQKPQDAGFDRMY